MADKYTRKLSFNERSYVANDMICSPFYNQFIHDGKGTLDLPLWKKAVEKASAVNPGSRVVLKGHLNSCRWVDSGETPRVRMVDGSGWSGTGPEGMPFVDEILDPFKGPVCEVVLIKGDPVRVVFRSLHSVMDGRGMAHWNTDIFRCLKGEEPIGSDSTLSDYELAWQFQKEGRFPPPHEFIAPTGKADGDELGITWKRLILKAKYKFILPQVAVLAAREAWRFSPGKVRFMIPIDLRFRQQDLRSTANLTNSIYIELTPESTMDTVVKDIGFQLENKCDCMIYHREKIMNYIPLKIMARGARALIKNKHKAGLYLNSGVLSDMGRIDVTNYAGAGFTTDYVWGIPPRQEVSPIFVGMSRGADYTTIIVSMPNVLASSGRLDEFIENITRGLVPVG